MGETSNRHIHIGAGRLGLGFVGYFSRKLGFSTVFFNRNARTKSSANRNSKLKTQKEYVIKYYDREEEDLIHFDDVHFFGRGLEDTGQCAELIAHQDTILLTTAVGESELPRIARLIAGGLRTRKKTSPLFILACENGHRCTQQLYEEVKRYLPAPNPEVIFADCVVDQVCQEIPAIHDKTQPEEHVSVIAESYRDWTIADKHETLKQILNHPCVTFVPDSRIDLYELRKLWLVNGLHLAVAVLGYREGIKEIAKAVDGTHGKLSEYINKIKSELANALIFRMNQDGYFITPSPDDYVNKVMERFRRSPDKCERILRDALLSDIRIEDAVRQFGSDLGSDIPLSKVLSTLLDECIFIFFKKVKDRLYEPMRLLFDRESAGPTALPLVLLSLIPFMVEQGDKWRSHSKKKRKRRAQSV